MNRNYFSLSTLFVFLTFFSLSVYAEEAENTNDALNDDIAMFSVYQEKYENNTITGFTVSGYDPQNTSLLRLSLNLGLKLEILEPKSARSNSIYRPAFDFSVGFYYGREVFVYSHFGLDLGEVLVSSLFECHESNIDVFLQTGVGFKIQNIGLSAYIKANDISGSGISPHNALYKGVQVTYYY